MTEYFTIFYISLWPIGDFEITYGKIPKCFLQWDKVHVRIWRFGLTIEMWWLSLIFKEGGTLRSDEMEE